MTPHETRIKACPSSGSPIQPETCKKQFGKRKHPQQFAEHRQSMLATLVRRSPTGCVRLCGLSFRSMYSTARLNKHSAWHETFQSRSTHCRAQALAPNCLLCLTSLEEFGSLLHPNGRRINLSTFKRLNENDVCGCVCVCLVK